MALALVTLGHGTATADELARLIRGASIGSLVDVRAVPKSRRHPQFWREELERWIPEAAKSTIASAKKLTCVLNLAGTSALFPAR